MGISAPNWRGRLKTTRHPHPKGLETLQLKSDPGHPDVAELRGDVQRPAAVVPRHVDVGWRHAPAVIVLNANGMHGAVSDPPGVSTTDGIAVPTVVQCGLPHPVW